MKNEVTPKSLTFWVVRQILLVRNHRQDFLYAKKRNPGYD